ncbi:MAG: undecaprenyl/decaprenyl-phosphate alpha-N-acetylglucosaminyl 1-phosphate transferase [Treponema sp.]|nr:undecaprenyl/decaprenyl-phosphate alpha-N-acetylglucosaminyl 1-phosphate transferase [Candidatus Treponema equifaecale]
MINLTVAIFAAAAFVASAFLVKVIISLCAKYKLYDEVNQRSVHTQPVARLGGIGIFIVYGVCCLIYQFYVGFEDLSHLPLYIGGALIWIEGVLDDLKNLRARFKFLFQLIVIALACAFSPYYIHDFLIWPLPAVLGKFITFCWIILLVNAFNLIDGIDLLCSTLVVVSIATVTVLFSLGGSLFVPGIILCCCIFGFMIFNKPKAKIFLGDSGSQTLGYCVAVMPLVGNLSKYDSNQALIMLILASVPVEDVIAAIWRRLRDKRSVFSADRAHIHHKLINVGLSKVQAWLYLSLLHLVNCVIIFIAFFMRKYSSMAVLFMAVIITQLFFIAIHYINRAVNRRFQGQLAENPQEEH